MKRLRTNDGIIDVEWAHGITGPIVYFQTVKLSGVKISVCSKNYNDQTHTAPEYVAGWFPEGVTTKIAELMALPFEELWEMAGGPEL